MSLAIADDRAAQLLVATDPLLDFPAAQARLERASLLLTWDGEAAEPWMQAALLAIARCGRRMFRGGLYMGADTGAPGRLRLGPAGAFRPQLVAEGARTTPPPPDALRLHVGAGGGDARIVCWADGWTGVVAPRALGERGRAGNEISGVLAAAMGLAEAFRIAVLGDLRAGRRLKRLSAWGPSEPATPEITCLPASAWLLGLGNLGQATLFVLGLLPYAHGGDLALVLQDFDVPGPENLPVQILTEPSWIGRRKARGCGDWAERRGFRTALVETAFTPLTRPGPTDPRLVLAGVDNLDARRWAAEAGFDLVVDAGLGATSADAFDLRLHAFPGSRSALQAWPEAAPDAPRALNPALEKAVAEGRLDRCGAMTIAGKSVGVPCTALAAAALQVGQACRALATGRCCDLIDASLADSGERLFKVMAPELRSLAFAPAYHP
ncbi:hypothetical protein [uncultured Phenylobacterium sp.]|uniref:hypothetical protein n=1 Tax=uncultured Phenylobacterium sp. TaxID=349273 RepID=UPI0025DFCDE8|nr:hypothetical protein [uncultured Phenylobacterium sp.]